MHVGKTPWLNQLTLWLQRWLQRLFGVSHRPQRRGHLEYYDRQFCLYRVEDDSIPGLIALYWIDRRDTTGRFVLCIIDIARLRSEMGGGDRLADRPDLRSVADTLKGQLADQSHVLATHLWVTGWLRIRSATDARGRAYQRYFFDSPDCVACNLRGDGGVFVGDRYAVQFARSTAHYLAKQAEERAKLKGLTWEDYLNAIDWRDWLQAMAERFIHPLYVVQPARKP